MMNKIPSYLIIGVYYLTVLPTVLGEKRKAQKHQCTFYYIFKVENKLKYY